MSATAIPIQDKVDELLAVLDKDIQHIQDSFRWLKELRSLVIKRDYPAASSLLGSIRAQIDSYAANELERKSVREDLANALGCSASQMTLSALEAALPKEKKAQVTDRKTKLRTLINQLRCEYLCTALLLSDCARFNNLLLRALFNFGKKGTLYYKPNGATKRRANTTFVDMKL